MAAYTEVLGSVAKPASVSHGATLSGAGALGIGLEWKHGTEAFVHAFANCEGFWDVVRRLLEMDTTTFLGLGAWILILGASAGAMTLGVYRLARLVVARMVRRSPAIDATSAPSAGEVA